MSVIKLGVDDGFYGTKVYGPPGMCSKNPQARAKVILSKVREGMTNTISFAGGGDDSNREYVYKTDGVSYVVGNKVQSTNIQSEQYPTSPYNRVVIQHGLQQFDKLQGRDVHIGTGLPIMRYFKEIGEKNVELIDSKNENSLVLTYPSKAKEQAINVKKAFTIPEAFAAVYDLIYTEKDPLAKSLKDKVEIDKTWVKKELGFIDIGGQTIDVGVLSGGNIDLSACVSESKGVNNIYKHLNHLLMEEFDAPKLRINTLDNILSSQVYQDQNVQPLIEEAYKTVAESVKATVQSVLGKGSELEKIYLFGGGFIRLQKYLDDFINKGTLEVLPDPAFANARGFYKYMEYESHLKR